MKSGCRISLAILLVAAILFSAIPRDCAAIPYKIEGYLKDSNGVPIPLANISISGELYDLGVQEMVPITLYRTTDVYGHYVIYIAANEPGGFFMDTVITVSYGAGDESTSTTVVVTGLSAWANLTYKEKASIGDVITSPLGILSIVVIISIVAIGYFVLRVEKPEKELPDEKPGRVERRRRHK